MLNPVIAGSDQAVEVGCFLKHSVDAFGVIRIEIRITRAHARTRVNPL